MVSDCKHHTKGSNASTLNKNNNNNNNNNNVNLYSLLLTMKILKVELEYWLPGMTTEASGAIGSHLTSALNRNKLQVSKITEAQMHT